jgi:methylglutamate dehydrogenase subunit D
MEQDCVSEIRLQTRPALAGLAAPGRYGARLPIAGVSVRELSARSLLHVEARRAFRDAAASRLATALGLSAAPEPRTLIRRDSTTLAWAGRDTWLVASDGGSLEADALEAIASYAAVVDQSDGRVSFALNGDAVCDVLLKGLSIDLHRRAFGETSVALTQVSHLAVHLWHVADFNTYEMIVPRAAIADVWHWLTESAAEFGLEVLEPRSN